MGSLNKECVIQTTDITRLPWKMFWAIFDGNTFHWMNIDDFEKSVEAS